MSLPKAVEHQYSPIMADIYGSQIYVLPRSGLADGKDEDDAWEKAAPSFHEWF